MHIVRYQVVNVSGTDQRVYSILGSFVERQKNLQISQKKLCSLVYDIFAFSFHDYDMNIGIDPIS